MSNEQLKAAIDEIKTGNKSTGKRMLLEILQREPENEIGWMWLSACADYDEEKIKYLSKVLEINPQNDKVIAALHRLQPSISEPNLEETISNPQNAGTEPLSSEINRLINEPRSVEFIPANCPNCGGELRVPVDRSVVKCMYCGHDVIIHDPNKIEVNLQLKFDISKPLKLAKIAEVGKNFEDGYKYYSQVLEHDQDNTSAWLGKARCVAWRTTLQSQTLDEAVSYVKNTLSINTGEISEIELTLANIAIATNKYTTLVMDYLQEQENIIQPLSRQMRSSVIANLEKMTEKMKMIKQLNGSFSRLYYPTIQRTLMYCWQNSQTKTVGSTIYTTFSQFMKSKVLIAETKSNIKKSFGSIISEIGKKFHDLPKPK